VNFGVLSSEFSEQRVSFDSETILHDLGKAVQRLSETAEIDQSRVFTRRITAEDSEEQDEIIKSSKKRIRLLYFFAVYISIFLISYLSIEFGSNKKDAPGGPPFIYMTLSGGIIGVISSLMLLHQFSNFSAPLRLSTESFAAYHLQRIKTTILFPIYGSGSLYPPLGLNYWRTVCDLLIGLRFLFIGLELESSSELCYASSGFLEFAEIASEAWYFCLCLELLLSIRNPFSSFKSRLFRYHICVWTLAIVIAVLIGSPYLKSQEGNIVVIDGAQYACVQGQSDIYSCSKYNPYDNGFTIARMFNPGQPKIDDYDDDPNPNLYYPYVQSSFCWVQGIAESNVNHLSAYPWIFLYCPLLIIIIFSFYTLYIAQSRFKSGVSMTLLHRLNILVLNYVNIFWFVV